MKVYIASFFADKDRVSTRCKELNALGIETTSRWANEQVLHNCKITDPSNEYLVETAVADVEDILVADKVVLTVPSLEEVMNLTPHQMSRGGRHFESGLMYGLILGEWLRYGREFYESAALEARGMKSELIIMGKRENVFHFLNGEGPAAKYPKVVVLPTWEEVREYLHSESLPKN